jgi:hypothetical protein
MREADLDRVDFIRLVKGLVNPKFSSEENYLVLDRECSGGIIATPKRYDAPVSNRGEEMKRRADEKKSFAEFLRSETDRTHEFEIKSHMFLEDLGRRLAGEGLISDPTAFFPTKLSPYEPDLGLIRFNTQDPEELIETIGEEEAKGRLSRYRYYTSEENVERYAMAKRLLIGNADTNRLLKIKDAGAAVFLREYEALRRALEK